jgi:hypothetical protein
MQYFLYFCPILIKIGPFRQILIRTPNVKFHENPAGGIVSNRDNNNEANDGITPLLCEGYQQLAANVLA